MEPVSRVTLVDQTAAALSAALQAGKWTGQLPGVRVLCAALKVSPPTLQAATARLVARGELISRGSRRRLEIAVRPKSPALPLPAAPHVPLPAAGTGRNKRVLCLTDDSLEQMHHHRLEILTQLRVRHPHWDLRHRVLNYREARVPHRQWDEVISAEQPDHLIVFNGNPAVAQWAKTRGVPLVFIGGDALPEQVPTVGFTPLTLVPAAVRALLRLGHRRICLPMFGLFPRLEEAQRRLFRELIEAQSLAFDEAWHTPSSPQSTPDVVLNTMAHVAAKAMPTAIIAMASNEFVSIQSFLSRLRLRIPDDVSVIVLRWSPSLEWFRPSLTHFAMQAGKISRIVQRWVDDGHPADSGVVGISGRLVAGESIAPPRKAD